ncbi:kappa-type opioid receptor-like [Gigantopelta aegis]|uniref:kappa-type opioid receptor-like n=1 Tax=Gigantopelta aegis TaxID=1735272 RepID=UPI001B88CE53|nr:kappa-type opioid receptor-like [Gigantopelta aegis]
MANVTHNLEDRNYSDDGDELQNSKTAPSGGWLHTEINGPGHWGIMLSIVITGIVGNILLFIMMRNTKVRFLSYSVYLKFLSVSDSLLLVMRLIQETDMIFILLSSTPVNDAFCKIESSIHILVMLLCPWLVVGLSLDRFVCVRCPMTRGRFCTQKKALFVCSTMLGISFVLAVPIVFKVEAVNEQCVSSHELYYYLAFIRLLIASSLPCVAILVLNILIIIRIRRSNAFRKTFARSRLRSDSANHQHDHSTRPLVIMSVMAFVTMVPAAVTESSYNLLGVYNRNVKAYELSQVILPPVRLIYLLNFGLNFYLLVLSSKNYRNIMKETLRCNRSTQYREQHVNSIS